jgi:outer membrane immunogenic protein
MKKILSILAAFLAATTATFAADMPAKAPAAPAVFNWSGCYLGVEDGGRWGRSNSVAASGANVGSTLTSFDVNGGLGGGTVGCNLQIDNFVLGLEDDYSWTNDSGGAKDQPPFPATTANVLNQRWINTLRGRFGYAFDRFLV